MIEHETYSAVREGLERWQHAEKQNVLFHKDMSINLLITTLAEVIQSATQAGVTSEAIDNGKQVLRNEQKKRQS